MSIQQALNKMDKNTRFRFCNPTTIIPIIGCLNCYWVVGIKKNRKVKCQMCKKEVR